MLHPQPGLLLQVQNVRNRNDKKREGRPLSLRKVHENLPPSMPSFFEHSTGINVRWNRGTRMQYEYLQGKVYQEIRDGTYAGHLHGCMRQEQWYIFRRIRSLYSENKLNLIFKLSLFMRWWNHMRRRGFYQP